MLDPEFLRMTMYGTAPGDQSLIAGEIVACLKAHRCANLWLPFSLGPLARYARSQGIVVREKISLEALGMQRLPVDSLYLGTPTIVANKKLFEESAPLPWTKRKERATVRELCGAAALLGARVIVTGLGSGDITVKNRIADMTLPGWTEPRVICMKDFGDFTDWLLFTKRNDDVKE